VLSKSFLKSPIGRLSFVFFFLIQLSSYSQLVGWDFNYTYDYGISPQAPNTLDANLNSSGLIRGNGVVLTGSAVNRAWGGKGWSNTEASAITNNDIITFSVSPKPGYAASLSALNPLTYRRSGTGPDSCKLQYKINSRSYIDISIFEFSSTSSTGSTIAPIDLSGIPALQLLPFTDTVTFRLIPFGGSSATGTFYLYDKDNNSNSDFGLEGTITNVGGIPYISIDNVSKAEGNAGTKIYQFNVFLSGPAPAGGVTFDIKTTDNTATAPSDYVPVNITSQTILEGNQSYTFDVIINGDTDIESNESFYVDISNIINANAGDIQGLGSLMDEDTPMNFTKIHTIQGSGSTFALGGTQTVEAIVTRNFSTSAGLNGFYIQEEESDYDADPNTSEGLFVYDPYGRFTGNQGDKVRVTGKVLEYNSGTSSSLTQLYSITQALVVSSDNPLPSAAVVTFPVAQISDLEKFENMLVRVSASTGSLTVTDTYDLSKYGQLLLSTIDASNQTGSDGRIDQFTQFNEPSVALNTAYLNNLEKRQFYIDDASGTQNPEVILFGRGGNPLSANNTIRGGDTVDEILAIMDHRFEGYRLQTQDPINFQASNPRLNTPATVGNLATLKVASFNVLNYFNGNGLGGGFPTSRGADNLAEFNRQRDKIVHALASLDADVVGLMEIENDGFGSESAIQDLINGINDIAGANTYQFIQPSVITATDEITVAIIYKPAKVAPQGAALVIPNSFGHAAFDVTGRKPLVQNFMEIGNSKTFTIGVNHYKSKGSVSPGLENEDQGDGQGNNNYLRTHQSQDLLNWIATNPSSASNSDIILLGDFNAYAMEDPLKHLENNGYVNLSPHEEHSYTFSSMWGSLDHAFASYSMSSKVAGSTIWHINAAEPIILDYNTENKSATQISNYYSNEPFRASDHDPVLIGLNLSVPCVNELVLETIINSSVDSSNKCNTC
jgi:uncharacterized protein